MSGPRYPLVAPPNITPTPHACEIVLGDYRVNGVRGVVMQIATPSGVQFCFLEADTAKQLGADLQERATGVVVAPSNGALGPFPGSS